MPFTKFSKREFHILKLDYLIASVRMPCICLFGFGVLALFMCSLFYNFLVLSKVLPVNSRRWHYMIQIINYSSFFRVALYFPYSFFLMWLGLVSSFNDEIGITGAILTKLDGDSRGGAALSVKEVFWLPKLLRIFLFYRCIKKLLIHYNTTHLIGPINGRYIITSLH